MKNICLILLSLIIITSCTDKKKEVEGTIRLGHEVRAFTDNQDKKEYWLIDKSGNLEKAYQKAIGSNMMNYRSVKAKLTVQDLGKIKEGFAAEYNGTYEVQEIISLTPISETKE